MAPDLTLPDQHRHVVQTAGLAPSVHNTQPWRFSSYGSGLDLWAEPTRRLPVLDPDGRQLHLSCGAALQHARVAARSIGLDPVVTLLPDPDDPLHLARLELVPGLPATDGEVALATAVLLRHTHRGAFDGRPVPADLMARLRHLADVEGATLHPLVREDDLLELEVLLARADREEEADPAYRREVADWLRTDPGVDGIPRDALPDDPERGSSLRLRDFALDGQPAPSGGDPPVAERPDVVLLITEQDGPRAWLEAGQALGSVLLAAAAEGVLAQPLGQVTDLPVFRGRLAHALGLLGTPQLALRMGLARSAATTSRRDVDDVLTGAQP